MYRSVWVVEVVEHLMHDDELELLRLYWWRKQVGVSKFSLMDAC